MTRWLSISSLCMALAVALGAFAAHGLKKSLSEYSLEVFGKANFYHFIHGLGLLLVVLLCETRIIGLELAERVCLLMFMGIVVFSGSLYALALTDLKWLGAVTPIGGSLFIISWLLLALGAGGYFGGR